MIPGKSGSPRRSLHTRLSRISCLTGRKRSPARGSALAPENTIQAFDNGLRLGADGIELDVRLSRDGVVVVHHDRTLERTTGLSGPVAMRTGAELSRAGVPALADVLTQFPSARVI